MIERRHEPLVFVADLDNPELDEPDDRHVKKSLRLKVGDPINVSDGAGRWRRAVLGRSELEPIGPIETEPRPDASGVAFAPVKGDRSSWVVQKLTELNVSEIVVMETERSVVRWDDERKAKQLDRLTRVAHEACGQSRRVWFPVISFDSLDGVLSRPGAVLADMDGRMPRKADRFIAVGPEGGWSSIESALADHVVLPGAILRAETAALTAAAILGSYP